MGWDQTSRVAVTKIHHTQGERKEPSTLQKRHTSITVLVQDNKPGGPFPSTSHFRIQTSFGFKPLSDSNQPISSSQQCCTGSSPSCIAPRERTAGNRGAWLVMLPQAASGPAEDFAVYKRLAGVVRGVTYSVGAFLPSLNDVNSKYRLL